MVLGDWLILKGKNCWKDWHCSKSAGENHAVYWFCPYDQPEICVTILVENGGDGSAAAAPIAATIIQKYFQLKNNKIVKN